MVRHRGRAGRVGRRGSQEQPSRPRHQQQREQQQDRAPGPAPILGNGDRREGAGRGRLGVEVEVLVPVEVGERVADGHLRGVQPPPVVQENNPAKDEEIKSPLSLADKVKKIKPESRGPAAT